MNDNTEIGREFSYFHPYFKRVDEDDYSKGYYVSDIVYQNDGGRWYRGFHANKEVKSVRKSGQKSFTTFKNYIEAANNDGPCPYNKATFSTELVLKLLGLYSRGGTVYDPFMGSGTTLAACESVGIDSIGSEISSNQCEWAKTRLENIGTVIGYDDFCACNEREEVDG